MDYLKMSVIVTLFGTMAIVMVYAYLYVLYRERSMGVWTLSWSVFFFCYFVFKPSAKNWQTVSWGLVIYELIMLVSILLFAWAIYLLVNKPFNKKWLLSSLFMIIIITVCNIVYPFYGFLAVIFYGCCFCFWAGWFFINRLPFQGVGRLITGYSYLLWGTLNLTMPFSVQWAWFAPWGYAMGGLLKLLIALATLMIYFEQTRMKLFEKEKQYRLVAENAVDVIYYLLLKPKRSLVYVSPSVYPLTGHTAAEYYWQQGLCRNTVHVDDRVLLCRAFRNLLRSGRSEPLTFRLIRKDRSIIWVEQRCQPVYEDGRLVAIEGIVRDVTERKNLESMSLTMIGDMAATVAHEIRNPLTTIRGYLQLFQLKQDYAQDQDRIDLMIGEIDKANTTIQKYLSLSQQKVPTIELCSLNEIIKALLPSLELQYKGLVVFNLLLGTIPELAVDKNDIRLLLLSLIRNGAEAMPTGGCITIMTARQEQQAVLTISDQGMGIEPAVLEVWGKPFVTTKPEGSGLGIPLCQQILRRHRAHSKIQTGTSGTKISIYFSLSER